MNLQSNAKYQIGNEQEAPFHLFAYQIIPPNFILFH